MHKKKKWLAVVDLKCKESTCDGLVFLCSPEVWFWLADLVVGHALNDGAGDFLYVSASHVEMDSLRRKSFITGTSDDNQL